LSNKIVVRNATPRPIRIEELRMILPADNKEYVLPLDIAKKYKDSLIPVKILKFELPPEEPKIKGSIFKKEPTKKAAKKVSKTKKKVASLKKPLAGKHVKAELKK